MVIEVRQPAKNKKKTAVTVGNTEITKKNKGKNCRVAKLIRNDKLRPNFFRAGSPLLVTDLHKFITYIEHHYQLV